MVFEWRDRNVLKYAVLFSLFIYSLFYYLYSFHYLYSSSYLDCYLYIDNGKLTTRLYDKRDDFNFPIVNFPFLSSNIPSAPAYGVYVSQLIRYARTCSNYQDFMERGKVLTQKLLSQGYQKIKLVATLKKFYGRHHDLVNPYNVAVSRIVSDVFASDAP